jgi:GNAT superfamily N-acetyltransferase
MSTSVHEIEASSGKMVLSEFLSKYLSRGADEQRYTWLYLDNPDGQARVWMATPSHSREMIGVAAAFPRRILHSGKEVRGWVLGDFSVHPNHRSLGPALALQRACLEGLSTGEEGFCLDFPSDAMLAVYKRLRINAKAEMIRLAKPLRVDRRVAAKLPVPFLAQGVSAIVNAGLRLRDRNLRSAEPLAFSVEAGPWGEEFTEAAFRWAGQQEVRVLRTAAYLNWRFGRHPGKTYTMLTARDNAELRGFLIYHLFEGNAFISDLHGQSDAVSKALLGWAVGRVRKEGANTVSAQWISIQRGRQLFEEAGFHPRESRPVVLLGLPHKDGCSTQSQTLSWCVTEGDRES